MPNNIYKRKFNYYIIYETTCTVNHKQYIGCHATNDLNDGYLGSGKLLLRAIKKYGRKNFQRTIIQEFNTPHEMFEQESQIVNEDYVSSSETYNIVIGGSGGFKIQNVDDWKRKLKISAKKRIARGDKHPFAGQHHTKETKKKISEASKGRTAWNKGLPGTWIGRVHSKESKKQMSESTKGMYAGKKNPMYGKSAVKGRKWYNNGIKTYYLFPEDLKINEYNLSLGRITRK